MIKSSPLQTFKLLGVITDSKLKFDYHIKPSGRKLKQSAIIHTARILRKVLEVGGGLLPMCVTPKMIIILSTLF